MNRLPDLEIEDEFEPCRYDLGDNACRWKDPRSEEEQSAEPLECNHSFADCRDKFCNESQFGGVRIEGARLTRAKGRLVALSEGGDAAIPGQVRIVTGDDVQAAISRSPGDHLDVVETEEEEGVAEV